MNKKVQIRILVCILSLFIFGCDNSVSPVVKNAEGYTIYGVLDLRKDTSYIRVKDINVPLIADSTTEFEGLVRLRNLTKGTSEILSNKKVAFEGIITHNFYSEEPIEEITDYQIEVERNGTVITSANTTTPSEGELTLSSDNPKCSDDLEIVIEPVLEGELISFNYGFNIKGQIYQLRAIFTFQEEGATEFRFRFIVEDALQDVVDANRLVIPQPLPSTCSDLSDQTIYMDYVHYGPDFIQDVGLGSVIVPGSFKRFGGLYDSTFSLAIDTLAVNDN